MAGVWLEVVIILLLVLANGVFAMSEISVVAARKIRLQHRAEEGDHRATPALELAQKPAQFLSTVQVGITLVGVLAGAYGGATLVAAAGRGACRRSLCSRRTPRGSRSASSWPASRVLSLILGELVPKSIGLRYPETIASWVAGPMMILSRVGGPVVGALTASTNVIMRLAGFKPVTGHKPHRGRDSRGDQRGRGDRRPRAGRGVDRPARVSARRSACRGDHDAARRHRVGGRRTSRAGAARVPDVAHATPSSWCATADLEHVLGTVRAAELLPAVLKGGHIDLRALLRDPLFVPDSMPAFKLLEAFRSSHRHLALVMDEFGAVEGLVSIGDLLEGLVGALPGDASEAQGSFVPRDDALVARRRLRADGRSRRARWVASARGREPARITRWPAS